MIKLITSILKNSFRKKQNVLWSLFFPVIFVLIFSLFDFSSTANINIIFVNDANSQFSNSVVENFSNITGFGVLENGDLESAKDLMQKGEKIEFQVYKDNSNIESENREPNVVVLLSNKLSDENLGKALFDDKKNLTIEIFYDNTQQSQMAPSSIVENILKDITLNSSIQMFNGRNIFEIQKEGISVKNISYFDYIVPGIIGMGIMQSGIMGIATAITTYKEKNIIKRLLATPLPIWKFLSAEIIRYLVLTFLQTTILLVLSTVVLKANIYGSIPLIYMITTIGSFTFLNIGFIAASIAKTSNSVTSIANIFTMPMMFLSGVFFARDTLPKIVQDVAGILPLSPLLDALRAVAINEAQLQDITKELTIMIIFGVVTFFIAARLFNFKEEK